MQFQFPRLTPTVKKLLIGIAAAFVVVAVVQNLAGYPLFGWLALDPNHTFLPALAWQPFTYWFVESPTPDAIFRLALTLLFVYFFLSPFEESFGAKRTIQLTAIGVLSAAVAAIALGFTGLPGRLIAGPDPIALAAFGAFPVIAGNREILFMFVIPMKVWTAILIGLGFSALLAVTAHDPYIFATYAAALGGGVAFAKWMTRPRTPKRKSPPRRRGGPDLRVVRGGSADDDRPRWLN